MYVNFIAVRKYIFVDSFLLCFVYKIFAVTILNITPQTERTFQSWMLTSFIEKKQFRIQFFFSVLQVYIVYRDFF